MFVDKLGVLQAECGDLFSVRSQARLGVLTEKLGCLACFNMGM